MDPRMKSGAEPKGSEEARAAAHDTGCFGASELLERVLSPNPQAALKRGGRTRAVPVLTDEREGAAGLPAWALGGAS